ncbi:hypothetical protein SSX86_027664 [Deinandra increscens subsp. villosa]|uniref:PLAC8 motif-containing protein n=1 Tax=Deinandra increscens subsp. villosa TaxID=3103831 RepID=A0AAP0CCE9_9ASTR
MAAAPGQWSSGLFDCDEDMSSCCLTCWCPCISFGQIAEIADKRNNSCFLHTILYTKLLLLTTGNCQWIYSCIYRSKLRKQYMLPEEPCDDCLVHCFCELCAICQEYRELKYRGLEPSLGWKENLARQSQGITMPPVPPSEMEMEMDS